MALVLNFIVLISYYKSNGFQNESENKSKRKQLYFYGVKLARIILWLMPIGVTLGCNHTPNLSWDLRQVSAHELNICKGSSCPELTVVYPNFHANDSTLLKKLNHLRDSLVIQTLYLGSDTPNFNLNIEQSMSQYLWVGLDYKTELQSAESYDGRIQIDASLQNDRELILEINSQLNLPEGPKIVHSKQTIKLIN